MNTVTFNCHCGSTVFNWRKGDVLVVTRETKKTIQHIANDGKKHVFSKRLFSEFSDK